MTAIVFIAAAGFYLFQLHSSQTVSNYDSGVYTIAAIHFVHGAWPYKDFVFVQPPGILLLLSPVAVLSYFFNSSVVFVAARAIMCLVNAANVSLIYKILARSSKRIAIVTALAYLLLPIMIFEDSAVKLEPPLLCLLLLVIARLTSATSFQALSNRELIGIGTLLGAALSLKYWAVIPIAAVVLLFAPAIKSRIGFFFAGLSGTSLLLVAPFLIADAPRFFSQTVLAQIHRNALSGWQSPRWLRLYYILGSANTPVSPNARTLIFVCFELGLVMVLGALLAHTRTVVWKVNTTFLASNFVFLMLVPEWFPYYASFVIPFGILATAFCVHFLAGSTPIQKLVARLGDDIRRLLSIIFVLGLVAGGIAALTTWTSTRALTTGSFIGQSSEIAYEVQPNSCAIFDVSYFAIEANRVSQSKNCPIVVDPSGMLLVDEEQRSDPQRQTKQWESIFSQADYVVLSQAASPFIPWNHSLTTYFSRNFVLVSKESVPLVFKNKRLR